MTIKDITSLEWASGFSIGSWTSLIGEFFLIGVLEAWEDLGRVESGREHEVVEQEDGTLWSWQGSLDSISVKFFSWYSIDSTLKVSTLFLITLMKVSSLEGAIVLRSF